MKSDLKDGEIIEKTDFKHGETLKEVIPEEISSFTSANFTSAKKLGIDVDIVMEILQNRIYTNKYIMFQELPANGLDAIKRRIISGDKSFHPEIKVTVDKRDNSVTISDNGCGMSEEVINNVYRFYGRSDKRNTMDEIGMFGIGSKSPFASADEFMLVTDSMADQMRRTYIVTKREIVPVSQEPSTGGYGTEITFARSNSETYEIEIMLSKFKYWNCPVNLYSVDQEGRTSLTRSFSRKTQATPEEVLDNIQIPPHTLKIETDDYVFVSGEEIKGTEVFVGGVPYPIYEFSGRMESYLKGRINIFIKNPNAITISATRESLERDEKFNNLLSDIDSKIEEEIKKRMREVFGSFDMKKSTNFGDVWYLYNLLRDCDYGSLVKKEYGLIHNICTMSAKYVLDSGYDSDKLMGALKFSNEKKKELVWTTSDIDKISRETIPENQMVVGLTENSGLCRDSRSCAECGQWDARAEGGTGACSRGYSKEHPFMKAFEKFVPVKLKKKVNPNHFKGLNLRNRKSVTFDVMNLDTSHYYFTSEEFKPIFGEVYLVSAERLKTLRKLNPKMRVVNGEDYNEKMLSNLKFNTVEGNSTNVENILKHKVVIQNVSPYGKHEIVYKEFGRPEDMFMRETVDEFLVKYLKQKGVKVCNIEQYMKLRKLKPKLRFKNVPQNVALDIVERMRGFSETVSVTRKGNVFTFERKPKGT